MKKEESKESPDAGQQSPPKHHHHASHNEAKQPELEKRLRSEIAPFNLQDLPLSLNDDEELFAERYLYQKTLGAGSFGVVVAAVDRTHLEQCAIKIISRDLAGYEVMEKLNLEAEVLSKLDHPNIVKFLKVLLCENRA